ncbi:MAG: DNA-binding response regulator [Methyloprofundus sp.]|nr:DNA-binding response regulator [Methyloprofundus sp.]
MTTILLFLANKTPLPPWVEGLSTQFEISIVHQIPANNNYLTIIDTDTLKNNNTFFTPFSQLNFRCLIIGKQWPDDQQVTALVNGAAGYCDFDESSKIIELALNSILKGEIWIQRHLVQQVIGALVNINSEKQKNAGIRSAEAKEKLKKLSARELDVAKMIKTGENNKKIAQHLNISDRTVKAHLTSAFKKLEINDRLQLALLMKEIF